MKKRILTTLMLVAASCTLWAAEMYPVRSDTLIIELGGNSKLIIFVDSQEDLRSLEDYDINQMIREINYSIESANGNPEEIQITDNSGDRFLKQEPVIEDMPPTIEQPQPAPVPATPAQPRVLDIKDLSASDTLYAELSNGEKVRLTFANTSPKEEEEEPVKPIQKWNPDYRTSRLSHNYFAVDFGLNNWMTDGEIPSGEGNLHTIKPVGSWYAGGRYFRRIAVGGALFIDFGGSATWYSWKFENKNVRVVKNPDEVHFIEDTSIKGIKSKLSASYINLELIPSLDFAYGKERIDKPEYRKKRYTKHIRPNGFRVGLGGYAGYRLDSWTKNVYKDANGEEQTDKEGSTYHLNNFRYGARLQVELDYDFSLFFNYDLNEVFVENKGPKLNAISFGVTLEL